MVTLLELRERSIHYIPDSRPAVFYIADREGGGILVNSPPYTTELNSALAQWAPVAFVFHPSRFGAAHGPAWRAAGAKTIAYGAEAAAIGGTDIVLDRGQRFSRGIDFLPMSGRTEASCALRCKGRPGVILFGPALSCGPAGWPELTACTDDFSYENRLLGAVALRRLRYEYALTDDFDLGRSRFGPGAGAMIGAHLKRLLGT